MQSWSRGFEATERSFDIIRKNKAILFYVIASALAIGIATFCVLYFKLNPDLPAILSIEHKLLTILAVPLILYAAKKLNITGRGITTSTVLWLLIWLAIEICFIIITEQFIPEAESSWISLQQVINVIWSALTYYVLIAIVIDGLNPLQATVNSIKGLRETYVEALGLEVSLMLLGFILVIPLIAIYMIFGAIDEESLLLKNIGAALIVPMSFVMMLAKYVGRTILYLYYKKAIPASYLEK